MYIATICILFLVKTSMAEEEKVYWIILERLCKQIIHFQPFSDFAASAGKFSCTKAFHRDYDLASWLKGEHETFKKPIVE